MVEVTQTYNFKEKIEKIQKYLEENNLEEKEIIKLKKVLFKIKNIDVIIENIDEELINEELKNEYDNFNAYCNNFLQGDINYLSSMVSSSDLMIKSLLKYVDYNIILNNKSKIKEYVKGYKYEITRQSKTIEKEVNNTIEYINQQKNSIENENGELNTKIREVNNKLDSLNSNQIQLQNNVDKFFDDTKNNVNELIKQETNNINILKENHEKELKENYNKLSEEYKSKFEELMKDISKKNKEISRLIGIVGDKARIGEYKKNADSSRVERIIWQIATVALFLISFGIMIYVIFITNDNNKTTIFKYIVSAILMGAAAYTGKQASNSRKDEVYYRKQELELASIDTYLENMNPENKEEIKKMLSPKMFGQAHNTYTNKYDDKKGFSTDDIIKIIEAIKNNSN